MPASEILPRYGNNPVYSFAALLVNGVNAHREELDRLISGHARDWTIDRMPVIDRNLLRIALFEMLHLEEVPAAVAINEAVDLARTYSTESSSRFVNGVLAAIEAERQASVVDNPPPGV